jgi:hypothetical protein
MPSLSDEAWAAICAAAGRKHPPDDETAASILIRGEPASSARAAVSAILFEEYPAFAYDREHIAQARERSRRMLKLLAELAELYRQTYLPDLPVDELKAILTGRAQPWIVDDLKTERDLRGIALLRRRPEALWLVACAIRRAHAHKKSVQWEWLIHRLCGVWLDCFHGELTFTVPPLGGAPRGPAIEFLRAAISQVEPEPSPATVRDGMRRERAERENARQMALDLRRRSARMPD